MAKNDAISYNEAKDIVNDLLYLTSQSKKDLIKNVNLLDVYYYDIDTEIDTDRNNRIMDCNAKRIYDILCLFSSEHNKIKLPKLKVTKKSNLKLIRLIVSFFNINSFDIQSYTLSTIHDERKDKTPQQYIQEALNTLEEFKSLEYYCLLKNGFYDEDLDIEDLTLHETFESDEFLDSLNGIPYQKKKKYSKYTQANYMQDYKKRFKENLIELSLKDSGELIKKSKAESILTTLNKISKYIQAIRIISQ